MSVVSNLAVPDPWQFRDRTFVWGQQTYLMGILNVTPDSFSDGGQFNTLETALTQAKQMVEQGAHLLDIGGQSTRPQAEEVPLEEELRRVIPVITALRREDHSEGPLQRDGSLPQNRAGAIASTPISIDTTRAAVAREAILAGANWVNDISGATYDPEMLPTVAEMGVPIVLMHIRGTPKTMQQMTLYQDLMVEIYEFLARRIEAAIAAGVAAERIILDPGIGFAKNYAQNLEILQKLPDLRSLGCPLLVGVSRKSFIGHILGQPDPQQRVWGTAAACCAAIAASADILRVHDVAPLRDVCKVADAIWR
jgi:dihydropteroate synthase